MVTMMQLTFHSILSRVRAVKGGLSASGIGFKLNTGFIMKLATPSREQFKRETST